MISNRVLDMKDRKYNCYFKKCYIYKRQEFHTEISIICYKAGIETITLSNVGHLFQGYSVDWMLIDVATYFSDH